jgi:hypothetical protein
MSKRLHGLVLFLIFLAACAPSAHQTGRSNQSASANQPVSAEIDRLDTARSGQFDFLSERKALSIFELPQTENGEIVLVDGYYEGDFKSYCLQPGTPDPSERDAYLMAPLRGYRQDIIESVLRNSLKKPHLEQKNIQLLLWSVVTGSNFNNLSFPVQSTAAQLLSPKQIFELRGGVMGVVKTLAAVMPETGLGNASRDINRLFELGSSSYEVYERVAVLRQPSTIRRPDFKKDQWYKQPEGYYVRYFPSGYQRIRIQVYVPGGSVDPTGKAGKKYFMFDPVTLMAVPANSNAQRLGIGAPVIDIIRQVIQIQKESGKDKKLSPRPKNPKTGETI